jgi:ribonucleoside-diphosphate reductase alpha chain
VEKLPRVKRQTSALPIVYSVVDSTEGWVEAVNLGMSLWFEGGDVTFDYSMIRPAGAVLKTKGGRASGPQPLKMMLDFLRSRVLARQGSFLRPIDAHDMMCMVGQAAVSGGSRRTAMISLFDWDDNEMRLSKSGDFERDNWQRWNAGETRSK